MHHSKSRYIQPWSTVDYRNVSCFKPKEWSNRVSFWIAVLLSTGSYFRALKGSCHSQAPVTHGTNCVQPKALPVPLSKASRQASSELSDLSNSSILMAQWWSFQFFCFMLAIPTHLLCCNQVFTLPTDDTDYFRPSILMSFRCSFKLFIFWITFFKEHKNNLDLCS